MDINSIYKSALMFEGKFEDNKIVYNKFRSILIKLMNFITYSVILSHLIVFLTDMDLFKNHLIYLKLSNEPKSKVLNLGMNFVIR